MTKAERTAGSHQIDEKFMSPRPTKNEMAKTEHEIVLLLQHTRERELILKTAATKGENVKDKLRQIREEIERLEITLPRGDTRFYCLACIWCLVAGVILVLVYKNAEQMIAGMWGTIDNAYLQQYRPGAVSLYKAGNFIASSAVAGMGFLFLLALLGFIQRRLQRRHARLAMGVFTLIETLIVLTLVLATFSILQ
jgi:hypothetical protein